MTDERFSTIAVEIETLKKEFENCAELSLRLCLVREMQTRLNEMEQLLRRGHANPSKSQNSPRHNL